MLGVNWVSSMIFSLGAMWRIEEKIVFLMCSTFRVGWYTSGYVAYLGTENVNSYKRKEKAHLLPLSQHVYAVLSGNHWWKCWYMGWDFQTFFLMNLEDIDVFTGYRGSDTLRRRSRLKFSFKGILTVHFIGFFFSSPVLHLLLQYLGAGEA